MPMSKARFEGESADLWKYKCRNIPSFNRADRTLSMNSDPTVLRPFFDFFAVRQRRQLCLLLERHVIHVLRILFEHSSGFAGSFCKKSTMGCLQRHLVQTRTIMCSTSSSTKGVAEESSHHWRFGKFDRKYPVKKAQPASVATKFYL